MRHAAVLRATLEQSRVSLDLLSAQLAGFEAYVKAQHQQATAPKATIETHPHCAEHPGACALRSEDARIEKGSLSNPNQWICKGCRCESHNGATLATA